MHSCWSLCIYNNCSGVLASLNTSATSRLKHSSVPSKNEEDKLAKANLKSQNNNDHSKPKLGNKQLEKGNSRGKKGTMLGTRI